MGRLKHGLLLGGLLGAGLMWLHTTKQGRELKRKIVKQAAEVYGDVKERVRNSEAIEKLTKSRYVTLVKEAVDDYAKKHPLAEQAKDIIVKIVMTQWDHIQSELAKQRRQTKKKSSPRQSALVVRPKR